MRYRPLVQAGAGGHQAAVGVLDVVTPHLLADQVDCGRYQGNAAIMGCNEADRFIPGWHDEAVVRDESLAVSGHVPVEVGSFVVERFVNQSEVVIPASFEEANVSSEQLSIGYEGSKEPATTIKDFHRQPE